MEKNETDGDFYMWGRGEMHTKFWWGNPKKRYHFEDLNVVGGRIILKWIFSK